MTVAVGASTAAGTYTTTVTGTGGGVTHTATVSLTVTPAGGTPFGVGTLDIPLEGDFNGDGRDDLAVYRPSTAQWFIPGIFPSGGVQYGQAAL